MYDIIIAQSGQIHKNFEINLLEQKVCFFVSYGNTLSRKLKFIT